MMSPPSPTAPHHAQLTMRTSPGPWLRWWWQGCGDDGDDGDDGRAVVMIHNIVNERAWNHVMEWEQHHER